MAFTLKNITQKYNSWNLFYLFLDDYIVYKYMNIYVLTFFLNLSVQQQQKTW